MASLCRVLGLRLALGAALLANACQRDSNADFDDSNLHPPGVGGSADTGGSNAAAGESPDAGSPAGGSEASAGGPGQGGNSSGGSGGSGGKASVGGKAGTDAGGSSGQGGKAAHGGMAGAMNGGTAGAATDPTPVTVDTTDIDDTNVAACMPNQNFGEEKSLNIDGDACAYETLMAFPRLELPAGALVSAATLTLTCINEGGPITVAYANEAWKELMVRWTSRPEVGATLGTVTCQQLGELTIDLTEAFQAWLAGDHAADGIYLRTEDSDGTDFASSEADKANTRPKLSVTYTLPVK